jgi:ketosteroid isomerase-like protein
MRAFECRVEANRLIAIAFFLFAMIVGCHKARRNNTVLTHKEAEQAIAELRSAYAAFNRGDIDSAVRFLDPQIEWIEPPEFPGGGTYHEVEGAKLYLTQSRAGATQVISEPEQFISSEDRIVVFVHARVLPKDSNTWQEIRLADVYTFQNGRATKMRAFANREEALRWVGIGDPQK